MAAKKTYPGTSKPGVRVTHGVDLEFDYKNWHDKEHHYLIRVETVEHGPYDEKGAGPGKGPNWVVHGDVLMRDGDPRDDMEPTRRRTFLLSKIKNLVSV